MIRVVHTRRMDGEPINYAQRFVAFVLVKLYLRQNLVHVVPVPATSRLTRSFIEGNFNRRAQYFILVPLRLRVVQISERAPVYIDAVNFPVGDEEPTWHHGVVGTFDALKKKKKNRLI